MVPADDGPELTPGGPETLDARDATVRSAAVMSGGTLLSRVTGLLRVEPHVAYRVDDLAGALEGHSVLAEPFDPTGTGSDFLRVAFVEADGAVVELMQYGDPDEEGWF